MVAMNVWPTDAADGSVANEARWRKMGRLWTPSAVASGIGLELAPSLAFPNLTVRNGAAWVDGHYCELTGDQVLTATANGLAVIRFDPVANTAELLYRDAVSAPSQSPSGTWELPIALVSASALVDVRSIARPITGVWFPTITARDESWNAPADGATCYTADCGYQWVRRTGTWVAVPSGYVGFATGPAAQQDVTTLVTVMSLLFPGVAGCRYRVTAYGNGSQITGASTNLYWQLAAMGSQAQVRFIQSYTLPVSNPFVGSGTSIFTATTTGSQNATLQALDSVAALRVSPNACWLAAEHIG